MIRSDRCRKNQYFSFLNEFLPLLVFTLVSIQGVAQEFPDFSDSGSQLHPPIISSRNIPSEEVSYVSDEDTFEGDAGDGASVESREGNQTHTVRKGDTLGSISKRFFGTTKYWKKIASSNGISEPGKLKVGMVLRIPTGVGKPATRRRRSKAISYPSFDAVQSLPPAPVPSLPPVSSGNDVVLYQDKGLPQILLPESIKNENTSRYSVTFEGLTGLMHTFAAYPLGKGLFSTSFGTVWNKITRRDGVRLKNGEDGDYWQFPIALTYAGDNFEAGLQLPFESYDIFAPITYNFRDGSDSGMGDASLRLKFSSQNDNMASCLGLGAIFPTNDRIIGNTDNDNAWEVFGGVSTKRKEGGNFHLNGGYQASSGNTTHEGIFFNVGFEYSANTSFTFMGEINSRNRVNNGRSTDLTLGLRYFVKPGMTFSLAAPIALNNDMFFGYDYRLEGQMQYHY
ncbi:LysM peptidoglycan-binding domain-containing protein [bacterium]|nr:LysM peptidoglycan-binding domain-containing protein [bacterium]